MTATTTSTAKFHEFYVIDRDREENRAMVVYHTMEANEFKPLRHVENVETETRYVTSDALGRNEVELNSLTFEEMVDEYFTGAIFTVSNEADDRASHQLPSGDSFTDVNIVMSEVTRGLNSYGFKWYMVPTAEQAREMIECNEAMVIEVTENGCHVFRR